MRFTLFALALFVTLGLAGDDARHEYARRAQALDAMDAGAHYKLALWCEAHGLAAEALRHHRAVVVIDEDHRASRRALGFERVHERWVSGKDIMRAKGFVEYDGRWLTKAEYELYAKDDIKAAEAKAARRAGDAALKLAWNTDPAVRARAMNQIGEIAQDYRLRPLSIAARIAHADVRRRAVEGLAALGTDAALPPLYKRAIFDAEETIRQAAVAAIGDVDAKGKIGPFVRALNSPLDPVRTHAIEALGALGDTGAIGPLVARYMVVGGSGQSVYISQVNQISYVQDFDVEVAQTAFIADPVIGVIQDGLTLNFRALATTGYIDVYERPALSRSLSSLSGKDLGDNPKAWAEWWRNERKSRRNDDS